MNTPSLRGRCLCGAVALSLEPTNRHVSACHCRMCRTWGGGPLMVVESKKPPRFEGEDHIRVYPSSDWAERGFCADCGTHLFYRLKGGSLHAVPVGLLEADPGWQFTEQVFIDEKPDFYGFANSTETLTGEQLFARAAAQGELPG